MKNILFAIALGFISFAHAQQKDAKMVSLLNKVSATYKTPSKLNFTYTLVNSKENINQKEEGSAYISNNKYNLNLLNNTQIYDGKKVYNISSEDKEITISSNPSKDELLTPTKILDSYKSGYTIKAGGSKTVNGKSATIVTLIPTNNSNTSSIDLAIDASKNELLSMVENTKQGSVTTITITSFSKNVIIPSAIFKVNTSYYKGKGYYVTEL